MSLRSYPKKQIRHFVAYLTLIALLPACIVVVENDERKDDDYYRRRWQLEIIVYSSGVYTPADGSVYSVSFSADDVLSGQADCVRYEGKYEVGRSSTLSINNLTPANGACGVDSISSMFLEELSQAQSITGNQDELVIHLDGADNLMRFKPY